MRKVHFEIVACKLSTILLNVLSRQLDLQIKLIIVCLITNDKIQC